MVHFSREMNVVNVAMPIINLIGRFIGSFMDVWNLQEHCHDCCHQFLHPRGDNTLHQGLLGHLQNPLQAKLGHLHQIQHFGWSLGKHFVMGV